MTLTKRLSIMGAALALLLAAFVLIMQPAEASGLQERVSGNFIDTAIDTNGDGLQANAWSGQAYGSGSPSYEGLVEIAFGPTGLCDEGEFEGTLVQYSIVRRYANGDLMFASSTRRWASASSVTSASGRSMPMKLRMRSIVARPVIGLSPSASTISGKRSIRC